MTATIDLTGIDDPRIDPIARDGIAAFKRAAESTSHEWREPHWFADALGATHLEWFTAERGLRLAFHANQWRAERIDRTHQSPNGGMPERSTDSHPLAFDEMWDWLHGESQT